MPEIDFQVNEFRIYKVNVDGVSFGFIDTGAGGYSPQRGEQFEYDGDTVILKDGRHFTNVPQLRGAISGGWCIRVGDKVTHYQPKAAGIKVRATEHRGTDRPIKTSVETIQAEEREVVSVADRKRRREATNETAAQRVPMETEEGRVALASGSSESPSTGDDDLDEIILAINEEMGEWVNEQRTDDGVEEGVEEEAKAQAEADILAMLNSVDEDEDEEKEKEKVPAPRRSARNLPVDAEDDRVVMPIVREEDVTETGTVVGNIGSKSKTIIERGEERPINVAPAKPLGKSPRPRERFGSAGAIIVDEQRDMGKISLSGSARGPIRLDESAKVQPGNTESIRMGDGAQVGTKKTAGKTPLTAVDGGVAVGRIRSPTHQSFTATDSNTSSTAIQRTQEGKQMRVEQYESDDQVVGKVSGNTTNTGAATGDVQEATVGDELTDVLPDAAVAKAPEVHRRPEEDPAYAAVKMMIPNFEWNKDRQVKERVAAALEHIKNPMYLKGILAVETDLAREEIKKALAAALENRGKKGKKKARKRA